MAITLLRGEISISNFFSAVSNLKETNLTAYIAYLLSIFPEYLGKLFLDRREKIEEIKIEQITENKERYDIVLVTYKKLIIIEAKLGFRQSEKQISKYIGNLINLNKKRAVLYLLDYGSYKASSWVRSVANRLPSRLGLKFMTWSEIHNQLDQLLKYKKAKDINESGYFIAKELKDFMEVNGMSNQKRKEVYVRDLSGHSMELFFKYRIYKSQPEFYNSAQGNLYFAPYFTRKAPKDFAGRSMIKIEKGISWIAPILDIQHLKINEISEYLKSKGHPKFKEATKEMFKETSRKELLIFLLGEPFLGFLTPISKTKLGVHGAMGSRSFTFRELFEAAAKGD